METTLWQSFIAALGSNDLPTSKTEDCWKPQARAQAFSPQHRQTHMMPSPAAEMEEPVPWIPFLDTSFRKSMTSCLRFVTLQGRTATLADVASYHKTFGCEISVVRTD